MATTLTQIPQFIWIIAAVRRDMPTITAKFTISPQLLSVKLAVLWFGITSAFRWSHPSGGGSCVTISALRAMPSISAV